MDTLRRYPRFLGTACVSSSHFELDSLWRNHHISSMPSFRAVYTVKFANAVYVLHAFQKKSKSGIKPRRQTLN
jgi:phage-related protein